MENLGQTQRTTFRVSFFLNKGKVRKDSNMPILARITVNGDKVSFYTKLDILPEMWDLQSMRSIGRTTEAKRINSVLDSILGKIQADYHFLQGRDGYVTAERLKNSFLGLDEQYETLLTFFDKHIEDLKERVPHDLSNSTLKKYILTRKRTEQFMNEKYKLKDVPLKSIRLIFVTDFEHWLRNHCRLSTNVLAKDIQFLKKILTLAHKSGIISVNPFAEYSIKKEKPKIKYLNDDELNRIIAKKFDCLRLEQIRDIFIFSCFTGMPYCDIATLTEDEIQKHFSSDLWLKYDRHKTGNKSDLPLLKIPLMILEKYKGKQKNGKCFPVPSNQKVNSYLKEIGDMCGIQQKLTFHLARHTFATKMLEVGISMESVSKMMGHTKLATTQIYGNITRNKIQREMASIVDSFEQQEELYKANCF